MHDALGVRGGEPARELGGHFEGLSHGQRAPLEPLAQRLSVEQLGHEVLDTVVPPHVMDHEHVRVVEGAGGPRFLLEAVETLRGVAHLARQDLDRHVAAETGVAGAVDLAHPARPDPLGHFVGSEPRSRRERRAARARSSSGVSGLFLRLLAGSLRRERIEGPTRENK